LDLAYRSGSVTTIQAHEVCEQDEFEIEYGIEPKLRHRPALTNRGAVIAYYATFTTKDGGYGFEVMSKDDIMAHAKKYSQSFGKGFSPWSSNFDEMAKKTVLKRALKYAPLKTEFARAVAADATIKTTIDADMSSVADETERNITPPEEAPAAAAEKPMTDAEADAILEASLDGAQG
jgi:recombination protein RecT